MAPLGASTAKKVTWLMSAVRPEHSSVFRHHSEYSSSVGTSQARSTGASGAPAALGRAHALADEKSSSPVMTRRIERLQ
jgi:hypothetical protein